VPRLILRKGHGKQLATILESTLPQLLQLLFLAYPLVTNVAFDAFSCYTFQDPKSAWLTQDVTIICGSDKHRAAKALAYVAMATYSVGLPVLYAVLLYTARHAIRGETESTVLSRSIAFLYTEYETSVYFWEIVEMLRRLLLVGVMVLFQGNMMQLTVGTLLAAVFFLFQMQANPYKANADDLLAATSSFCLVVVFLCATAFKYQLPFNDPGLQLKMSDEQKETFVMSIETLTQITIWSTLGALALTCAILFVQLTSEAREEVRWRNLQAQWQVPTSDPPWCEWRPRRGNKYSTFLSHFKIEVASEARYLSDLLRKMLRCGAFLDSSTLTDLRVLFDEGLLKSEVLTI